MIKKLKNTRWKQTEIKSLSEMISSFSKKTANSKYVIVQPMLWEIFNDVVSKDIKQFRVKNDNPDIKKKWKVEFPFTEETASMLISCGFIQNENIFYFDPKDLKKFALYQKLK